MRLGRMIQSQFGPVPSPQSSDCGPNLGAGLQLKTCSKCKRELPLDQFVNSNRYRDGKYSSCKECRKKVSLLRLQENPLCCRCRESPHQKNQSYCLRCARIMKGRPPERSRRKALRPDLCPACNVRPKETSRGYCRICATLAHRKWIKSRGGIWAYATSRGLRHKLVARAYVNHLIYTHKLARQPCEVCGKLEVEAHHNSYENALDIRWLCEEHHQALERWIRMKRKKGVDRTKVLL